MPVEDLAGRRKTVSEAMDESMEHLVEKYQVPAIHLRFPSAWRNEEPRLGWPELEPILNWR
jgi:hypothetical protein